MALLFLCSYWALLPPPPPFPKKKVLQNGIVGHLSMVLQLWVSNVIYYGKPKDWKQFSIVCVSKIKLALSSKQKFEKFDVAVDVLQNTQNSVILPCCFSEDSNNNVLRVIMQMPIFFFCSWNKRWCGVMVCWSFLLDCAPNCDIINRCIREPFWQSLFGSWKRTQNYKNVWSKIGFLSWNAPGRKIFVQYLFFFFGFHV